MLTEAKVRTSLLLLLRRLPATGNGTRYRVLERAAETDGASYTVEVLARGSAEGFMQDLAGSLPAHEHLDQEEELRVLEGKLGWVKGRTMREGGILAAGQTLVISKGEAAAAGWGMHCSTATWCQPATCAELLAGHVCNYITVCDCIAHRISLQLQRSTSVACRRARVRCWHHCHATGCWRAVLRASVTP